MFGQLTATGDENKIDSLLTLIKTEKEDTNQVNILTSLGFEYSVQNFSKAKFYLNKAEQLARKLAFKKGVANSLSYLGIAYETQGDYFEALNAQIAALKIREEIGDKSGISYSIHYIGDIYFGQSDLSEKTSSKEDYNSKALEQFFKALQIAEEAGNEKSVANTFNCIGNSYREQENYSSALDYYFKAVKIRERIGDKINLSTTFVNIGKLYLKQENYPTALEYLFRALKLSEELGHKRTTIKALGTIGIIYFKQKKYDKSIEYCNKSIALGKKVGYLEYIAKANNWLSQIYSADDFTGHNSDRAFEYYKAYIMEKDSIDTKKASQVELQFDFDRKEELAKVEHAKQIAISETEKKKQKIIIWSIASGLLFVIVFAGFIFRSLHITQKQKSIIEAKEKETQLQKHLIEDKQKEILESITYAKRLQEAILPPKEFVNKHVPDNFILYRPKDIVAGDFYWAECVGSKFFIAAADSTGHGVPGAMVSVVCSNALNRSVKEFGLRETGKILDKTRELVIETFEKSTSEVKDGMDISLLCIDRQNQKVYWSGANNPLWYIQNNELKEIKADKQPIGKTDHAKPFTTHELEYKENTTFYLFTDGLADQFGGPNGKKFKYKQFSDLLLQHSNLDPEQQTLLIDKVFSEWKGELEQVDDVCVIGIKI
ncbi:tetratricopeptide repeat protein [Aurantibacillus circumpalustris]|uniref:tetratricopeptide repeat protein n=1 Tax=Aurantibacillus circumpalustris TaxID=3036359 RepID=UPI00295B95EF|nr:tetratricopeptide repeat protein [Aurantibacillus circumpalustris]